MLTNPFISICIPAYKNKVFLERLLSSIEKQTFRNFEVIVSDDSPDDSLYDLLGVYNQKLEITYIRNIPALGSPANWNNAIRKATGRWIKIMHDDDWFNGSGSLQKFADEAKKDEVELIFSGFSNINVESNWQNKYVMRWWHRFLLRKTPLNLLMKNFIGHPSTTLIRNNRKDWFNEEMKWVVDIEFYIRMLSNNRNFVSIPEPLLNIGIGSEQITTLVFRKPEVEIPENIALLNILKPQALRNIPAYDYYWRFIRNLSIRTIGYLDKYNGRAVSPLLLQKMILQQAKLPIPFLKVGVFSKTAMLITYIWNRLMNRMK